MLRVTERTDSMLDASKSESNIALKDSGLRFLWITLIVITVDQITKFAVIDAFKLYESVQYTPFFNLTYVRNYGAAFSFLGDAGGWQRWFFTAIAIGVSGYLLYWLRTIGRDQKLQPIAFCLVLGGAIGNVYDRIVYGYVIDFLDVYVGSYHWPAFNVADSAIFLGACFLIFDWYKHGDRSEK